MWLEVTEIVLKVLILFALTMDFLRTKEYLEELDHMKHEIWKLKYEVYEQGSQMRRQAHG